MAAPDVSERAELEQRLARCPLLYPSIGSAFVGREEDVARLRDHLARSPLAILRAEREGQGSTRLALEYGHRMSHEYPGGALWIPRRASYPKELAADVVEALGLPQSCSQRYPFVATDTAFETMWRGLRERPRTLVVLDGWEEWDEAARWRDETANVHVLVVAPPRVAVNSEYLFAVGPLSAEAVAQRLEAHGGESCSTDFAEDALALALFLAADAKPTAGTEIVGWAIESLSLDARRALALMTLFNAEPIPHRALTAAADRIARTDATFNCERGIDELATRGLCQVTVFGEPYAHVRILSEARERLAEHYRPWRAFVLEALVEEAEAQTWETPHSARRIELHVRRALADDFEGSVPSELFVRLTGAAASGARYGVAAQAAAKAVDVARARKDDRALLEALKLRGKMLSETRDLVRAQIVLREAVGIAEHLYGEDAIEVAGVLSMLDRALGLGVCGSSSDEELAIAQRALAICERAWGPDDPRLAGSLWHVGLKHAVRGEFDAALTAQARGVALSRTANAPLDDLLQSYAVTLAEVGRFDEAFSALDEALERRRASGGQRVSNVLLAARGVAEKASRPEWLLEKVDAVLSWSEVEDDADERQEVSRARMLALRAVALAKIGRSEEAASAAREALLVLAPRLGDHERVVELREIAGRA